MATRVPHSARTPSNASGDHSLNTMLAHAFSRFRETGRAALATMQKAIVEQDVEGIVLSARTLKRVSTAAGATPVVEAISEMLVGLLSPLHTSPLDHAPLMVLPESVQADVDKIEARYDAFAAEVTASATPTKSSNRYSRAAGEGVDEASRTLRSWNKQVYEARVAKKFMEEQDLVAQCARSVPSAQSLCVPHCSKATRLTT
jgi:predicted Ser/Thr protein kinase